MIRAAIEGFIIGFACGCVAAGLVLHQAGMLR